MTVTELLTTAQAAARLNVAESTLRYWRHRSEGPPAIRLVGTIRYPANQLEAWITGQAQRTA